MLACTIFTSVITMSWNRRRAQALLTCTESSPTMSAIAFDCIPLGASGLSPPTRSDAHNIVRTTWTAKFVCWSGWAEEARMEETQVLRIDGHYSVQACMRFGPSLVISALTHVLSGFRQ